MSYDAWLEQPYQDRYAEGERYVAWCEANDLDPSEDHHEAYDVDVEERLEEIAERRAGDRAEAQADRIADRDIW